MANECEAKIGEFLATLVRYINIQDAYGVVENLFRTEAKIPYYIREELSREADSILTALGDELTKLRSHLIDLMKEAIKECVKE